MPKGNDPVTKFLVSRPQSGDVLLSRSRQTVYSAAGDEALYAIVTNYLVQIQNDKLMSWDNSTSAAQSYTQEYKTELKVTNGSEVSNTIGLSAAYKGITISAEHSEKTFHSEETTTSKTETTRVEVAPRSELFFYQRKYVLRSDVYFILDAWNEEWIVGSWEGYDVSHARCDVEIHSNDYITSETSLKGETTINVDAASVKDFDAGLRIRKFENCTERAKGTMRAMGVNGLRH